MTDKEVFKAYQDKYGFTDDDYFFEYQDVVKSTYNYKLFKLKIAMDELKQSIKDTLFFWRKG